MSQSQIIYKILYDAEMYGQEYLEKIEEIQSNGQDVTEEKTRFTILWMLIKALRRYYEANFEADGTVIDPPTVDCLSTEQYNDLVRKIKEITEGKTYVLSDWILETGTWQDSGVWRDTSQWYDS